MPRGGEQGLKARALIALKFGPKRAQHLRIKLALAFAAEREVGGLKGSPERKLAGAIILSLCWLHVPNANLSS
jgi:hypothetical protein